MSDRIIRVPLAAAAVVFVASVAACGRAELATTPDLGVENQRARHTVSGDTTTQTVNGIYGLGSGGLVEPPVTGEHRGNYGMGSGG